MRGEIVAVNENGKLRVLDPMESIDAAIRESRNERGPVGVDRVHDAAYEWYEWYWWREARKARSATHASSHVVKERSK